jgi:hypothetical protein
VQVVTPFGLAWASLGGLTRSNEVGHPMSTMIAPPRNEASGRRAGEARLVVPDVSWRVYETWVDALPESTPVRMAYDGRHLEIMTKGPDHEDYASSWGILSSRSHGRCSYR